jgi:hypothetical protein
MLSGLPGNYLRFPVRHKQKVFMIQWMCIKKAKTKDSFHLDLKQNDRNCPPVLLLLVRHASIKYPVDP